MNDNQKELLNLCKDNILVICAFRKANCQRTLRNTHCLEFTFCKKDLSKLFVAQLLSDGHLQYHNGVFENISIEKGFFHLTFEKIVLDLKNDIQKPLFLLTQQLDYFYKGFGATKFNTTYLSLFSSTAEQLCYFYKRAGVSEFDIASYFSFIEILNYLNNNVHLRQPNHFYEVNVAYN